MKKLLFLVFVMLLSVYSVVSASPLSIFNTGWTQFADDDGVGSGGYVNPGWGGQTFDAEYLFYKLQGGILSIGLQAGFNLQTGYESVSVNPKHYYAGDLALSFDGDSTNYEYAADFGLLTKDYYLNKVGNNTTGINTAGLYDSVQWNNNVYSGFIQSNPFAMKSGHLLAAFDSTTNLSGSDLNVGSYYRIVSFPVYLIPITGNTINLNAHWTMSCGNDALNGSAHPKLPEPGTMFLLGSLATGLFGLAGLRKRFTK